MKSASRLITAFAPEHYDLSITLNREAHAHSKAPLPLTAPALPTLKKFAFTLRTLLLTLPPLTAKKRHIH